MWAWLTSFFTSKVIPATKHAVWRAVSVACVVAVGLVLVLGVKRIFYPRPTTAQHIESGGVANTLTYHISVWPGGCARISPEVKNAKPTHNPASK